MQGFKVALSFFPLQLYLFFLVGGAAVLHNGLLGMPITPALAGYSFAPRPAGKGHNNNYQGSHLMVLVLQSTLTILPWEIKQL